MLTTSGIALLVTAVTTAEAGSFILATAPITGTILLFAGLGIMQADHEQSEIEQNMFTLGAGEYGGTLKVSTYGVFNTYTISTQKGSLTSWGITSITPIVMAMSVLPNHDWQPNP